MKPIKRNLTCRSILLLAFILPISSLTAADNNLRQEPGAEYADHKIRRTYKYVEATDLLEGSPEWVYRQLLIVSKKFDFLELSKYQTPAGVWGARQTTPEQMASFTAVLLDGKLRVGDSKIEEDRAYVYMGFALDDGLGAWKIDYRYFLKREGKWLICFFNEWQSGQMRPTPAGYDDWLKSLEKK